MKEEKYDIHVEFYTIGQLLLEHVVSMRKAGLSMLEIDRAVDQYLEARDGFLGKMAGTDCDLRDLDDDLEEINQYVSEAVEHWQAGRFELACHMVSEGMKDIGLRVDEFWRNDDMYNGWRHKVTSGGLSVIDDGRELRTDFLPAADLRRLGVMYNDACLVKIDGRYWIRDTYLSDADICTVYAYYMYIEWDEPDSMEIYKENFEEMGVKTQEELRAWINRRIERNIERQEEYWQGERGVRLANLDMNSPVRKDELKRLMDDNYLPERCHLLRRKRKGEKYLL